MGTRKMIDHARRHRLYGMVTKRGKKIGEPLGYDRFGYWVLDGKVYVVHERGEAHLYGRDGGDYHAFIQGVRSGRIIAHVVV